MYLHVLFYDIKSSIRVKVHVFLTHVLMEMEDLRKTSYLKITTGTNKLDVYTDYNYECSFLLLLVIC